jgi:hypothetical protein
VSTTVTIMVLGGGLLLIFGGLIGHSLSQYLLDAEIRRQAALRREIGEKWRAIQKDRSRGGRRHRCPNCRDGANQVGSAPYRYRPR